MSLPITRLKYRIDNREGNGQAKRGHFSALAFPMDDLLPAQVRRSAFCGVNWSNALGSAQAGVPRCVPYYFLSIDMDIHFG